MSIEKAAGTELVAAVLVTLDPGTAQRPRTPIAWGARGCHRPKKGVWSGVQKVK